MSSPTGEDDDAFWRRPPGDGTTEPRWPPGRPPDAPADPPYAGPPRTTPPPPGWRPPFVVQPTPPRRLPAQDLDDLDEAERSARTITYGVGMIAGAIMLVLLCLLCSRVLF
ncbi:MAG TPA: translation initiation factor 2 [Catenuloplanes sp.]